MHLGGNMGFSTIHPLLVGRVVKAVKDAGGKPFVTDGPGAVGGARERGYTEEVLGARWCRWPAESATSTSTPARSTSAR